MRRRKLGVPRRRTVQKCALGYTVRNQWSGDVPWARISMAARLCSIETRSSTIGYTVSNFAGRVDSPSSQSKSCSDKVALLSCISLLNTFLATLVNPSSCYLDYMVLPSSAYRPDSFDRAFKGRLRSITTEGWPIGFSINYIETLTTQQILPLTLTRGKAFDATAPASILYVPGRLTEVIFNGVKMGSRFPPDARATSCLCRARFAKDFLGIVCQEMPLLYSALPTECTYAGLKQHVGEQRRLVKQSVRKALGGWIVNDGDGEFILGDLVSTGV